MSMQSKKSKTRNEQKYKFRKRIQNEITRRVKYEIDFTNRIGKIETTTISASAIGKREGFKELADYDAVGSFAEFQKACGPGNNLETLQRVLEVEQTGWLKNQLVNRHHIFGSNENQAIILNNDSIEKTELHTTKGSTAEFLNQVQPIMDKSDTVIVLYLAALWSVLGARTSSSVGQIICVTGPGSTGKTSALCLATSIFQKAIDDQYLLNFGDTEGVLLDRIPIMAGALNAFTDFKNDPNEATGQGLKKLRTLLFSATSGKPRRRKGEKNIKLKRPVLNVQLAFAMEISVLEAFKKTKISLEDGERARILELKVQDRNKGGIFDQLDAKEAKNLANKLDKLLRTNYGHVGAEWVEFIQKYELKKLTQEVRKKARKRFRNKEEDDGLVNRIEKYIKRLMATALLADEAELLPVSIKRVSLALQNTFDTNVMPIFSDNKKSAEIKKKVLKHLLDDETFPKILKGAALEKGVNVTNGFRRLNRKNQIKLYVRQNEFLDHIDEDVGKAIEYLCELADSGYARTEINKNGHRKRTYPVKISGINEKFNYMIFDLVKLERHAKNILNL